MKTENSVLMKQARESLKGKWAIAIGGFVVYTILTSAVGQIPKAGPLLAILIAGPMTLGLRTFTLSISRNLTPKLDQLFSGFKEFENSFVAYLLVTVFTLLWSLLLIIPGIIAALSYSMTFFIIADDKSVRGREAINRSKVMMDGNKMKLLTLNLRFIGWALLCILTLGIGFLWLIPYMQVSLAKFYDDIKNTPVPVVV